MEQSKFILEIQSRPCLWNPGVESFWDRVLKRKIWEEVAAKMYNHYKHFSDDEKRDAVIELQRNWKSLTDFYKRRNPKLDIDERTQRKKPIVEMLQFLDSITRFKREKKPRSRARKKTLKVKNTNVIFQIPKYDKPFTRNNYKPELSNELQLTDRHRPEHVSDLKFLQSLLPDMQSLDDNQRFEFKLGVMKLIQKIKYDKEMPAVSIKTDVSQDYMFCDQPTTFIIQTSSVENSPRSLSPINISLTPQEQLMIDDIEPKLKLISAPDLDLNEDIIAMSRDAETGSMVKVDHS